jgi:hypothetical protein
MNRVAQQAAGVMAAAVALAAGPAHALLPEPDKAMFGTMTVTGAAVTAVHTQYVVEARSSLGEVLGSYRMGSNTNRTHVWSDYFYTLRASVESYTNLATAKIKIGDNLHMVLLNGTSEVMHLVHPITERGATRFDFGPPADTDGDGIPDLDEINLGTNPNDSDTDDDGLVDGQEVNSYGSNPFVANSDGDGLTDGEEAALGSDPTNNASFATTLAGDVIYSGGQTGTVRVFAPRWPSQALGLDGIDDYVALSGPVYDQAGEVTDLTVDAWIKSDGTNRQVIASFDRTAGWELAIHETGVAEFTTTDEAGASHTLAGIALVRNGAWYHLAATYTASSGTKRLYVDGVEDIAATNAHVAGRRLVGGAEIGARYGFIGVDSDASTYDGAKGSHYFYGAIDEVRIWSRAFTAAEVRRYRLANPLSRNQTNLVAQWGFDAGTGADSTIWTNNGVFMGGAGATGIGTINGGRAQGAVSTNIPAPGPYAMTNVVTLLDYHPYAFRDTDGDGTRDYWEAWGTHSNGLVTVNGPVSGFDIILSDPDSDSDGLADYVELGIGTDPFDTDTDNDGLTDGQEVNTYSTDPLDTDSDDDGLTDGSEVNTHGTDPNDADTDNDAMDDKYEVDNGLNPLVDDSSGDLDGDCLNNLRDYLAGLLASTNDTDGDGLWDGWEWTYSTNNAAKTNGPYMDALDSGLTASNQAASADLDADGLSNAGEFDYWLTNRFALAGCDAGSPTNRASPDPTVADTDSDGLADGAEVHTHETDPLDADTDNDGLTDGDEVNTHSTDPLDTDTDNDGLTDGDEVNTHGTDPLDADSDDDGLSDGDEVNTHGTDPNDADTDNDGMWDGYEINNGLNPLVDDSQADGDGDCLVGVLEFRAGTLATTNDTDGDALWDGWEWTFSTNNPFRTNTVHLDVLDDGSTDTNQARGVDLDNDGLSTAQEFAYWMTNRFMLSGCGANSPTNRQTLDPTLRDTDRDGSIDGVEVANGTDPIDNDTDNDGLLDGEEIDTDNDGLLDYREMYEYGTDPVDGDSDNDGLSDGAEINTHGTDPNDADSDNDGLSDGDEVNTHGTDPNDADSDNDGLSDGAEVNTHGTDPNDADSDNDGLSDGAEINTHGTDPNDADSDNDGLNDAAEVNTSHTDPNDADSDDDGLGDALEVLTTHTDPNDADSDDDGLSDATEVNVTNTDPNDADSDNDGVSDGVEVNVNGTDPNDASSRLASISGTVAYAGAQTGTIHVVAARWPSRVLTLDGVNDAVAISGLSYSVAGAVSNITVEGWVRTTSQAHNVIASFDDSAAWQLSIGDGSGTHAGKLHFDTTDGAGGYQRLRGTRLLNDGQWHHVAATYDAASGAKRIYVDGAFEAEAALAHAPGMGLVGGAEIGVRHGFIGAQSEASSFNGSTATGTYFQGMIDELRLWNATLGAADVKKYMAQHPKPIASNLVAWWRFDDQTAGDASMSGYDGAFVGGASNVQVTAIVAGLFQAVGETTLAAPGAYAISNLVTPGDYFVFAYRDSNGDCLRQYYEAQGRHTNSPITLTTNRAGVHIVMTDPTIFTPLPGNPDTDSDGLSDADEVNIFNSDPLDPDTDNDGLLDGEEVFLYGTSPTKPDTDDDGMPDPWEIANGTNPLVNDANADSDGDGLKNIGEYQQGTDPLDSDTDNDGLSDGAEVNTRHTDPLDPDTDNDNLSDGAEVNTHNTDPLDPDTDNDGLTDDVEVLVTGSNPRDTDTDDDGLGDAAEVGLHLTNPNLEDTDGDKAYDPWEIDVGTNPNATNQVPFRKVKDFDRDSIDDITVYDPFQATWYIRQSRFGGQTRQQKWGWFVVVPAPGDYDNDGKTDIGVFVPETGDWYIQLSKTNNGFRGRQWGWMQAIPVAADYDGDGKTDIAVYNPATGEWYIEQSGLNYSIRVSQWGWNQAIPVPGDYDGDGKADLAVYYPPGSNWYIQSSINGSLRQVQLGGPNIVPVQADYDGDRRIDIGVYRPSDGLWQVVYSANSQLVQGNWGWSEAVPVPADYDRDGKADLAVYSRFTGAWYILKSTDNQQLGGGPIPWGWGEALPVIPQFWINLLYGIEPAVHLPPDYIYYELDD